MEQISVKQPWVKIEHTGHSLTIRGGGSWLATGLKNIDPVIRSVDLSNVKTCTIHLEHISAIDISGAWLIERFKRILEAAQIPYHIASKNHSLDEILDQIKDFKRIREPDFSQPPQVIRWIEEVGVAAVKGYRDAILMISFLGELTVSLFQCLAHPSKLRPISVISVLNRAGLNAIPIVGLIALLIGVVLIYQGSFQLTKFGAEIYTVDLLAVSLLRELGILLTAIMVAGRSGSAFAAEIGTMKLNQEIDALQTFGLNPMEVLVIPRVMALFLALPLLAFITDIIGLAGGSIMAYVVLDISFTQYLQQLNQSLSSTTFWVGIIKAPVFGFIIAMVGCFEGMQVHGGALSVGRKTTKAVVESIFLVVVIDALFSVLFTKLDW